MPAIDSKKLTAWYNFQAPFYSLWRDGGRHPSFDTVLSALGRGERAKILDAGCGSGLFALPVALERKGWSVVGVDASQGMIGVARCRQDGLGLTNLDLQVGDLSSLPFADNTFDGVILAGVCPNLANPLSCLRELRRILVPGGRLVVVEFDRRRMQFVTRCFFHVMIWGYRLVSALLRRFRFAENWSLEATTILSEDLMEMLKSAGFEALSMSHVADYYVLTASRGYA